MYWVIGGTDYTIEIQRVCVNKFHLYNEINHLEMQVSYWPRFIFYFITNRRIIPNITFGQLFLLPSKRKKISHNVSQQSFKSLIL
jgi:hypothetical protein